MATIDWTGAAGDGNWDTAGNWSGDVLPGPSDAVVIPSGFDVTHDDDDTDKIASLSVAAGDTLSIGLGALSLASASTIDGTLVLTGEPDQTKEIGGTLELSGDLSVGTFEQTGGIVSSTADVTVSGSATLDGGSQTGLGTTTCWARQSSTSTLTTST